MKKLLELNQGHGSNATVHRGRPSSFKQHAKELVTWVLDLHREGMPVSMGMAILKASQMDSNLRHKKPMSRYSVIRRIFRSHGIRILCKTHESQDLPPKKQDDAKAFVKGTIPSVNMPGRDKHFIINMDQTPVFFSMTPKTTLDERGTRSVNVRASTTGSTMRSIFVVSVTAAGGTLPLMIVYKGKQNGCIVRDFTDATKGYPAGCSYVCQESAWMDERVMLEWVNNVLKPYVATVPPDIVPLLFLDSYKCYLMSSVVSKIQDLGIEVNHIPGGCTGLTQPVDVGINKPLKNRIRNKWEDYMLTEGLLHNRTKPPTHQQLASWCIDSMKEMDEQIVKNVWLHGEYSFFPVDVAARSGASIADPYEAHAEMIMREDKEDKEDEIEKLEEEDEVLRMAV
jgi:DDE superfamily endonuclease